MELGEKTIACVAMRGRNPENPSDRRTGIDTEQVLEMKYEDVTNTLTCVQKDNLVLEQTVVTGEVPEDLKKWVWEIDGIKYLVRLRKLTPRESWRLMDFTDEEFDKAEAVCSNTQLIKQAGNSIAKGVLCEVFRQLIE